MATGSFKLPISSGSTEWVRPSDWLAMPTGITSANQTFVGLHAVIENADNYVAFLFTTSAGQYRVDWGDGTVTLHNSNTIAQYQYNFASISNSTLTSRGYKQAMITVTAVSGNLLTCNFQQRYVTSPVQNQTYSTGFLDCILSLPNATTGSSISFGGTGSVIQRYVERFDIKTIGSCTSLSGVFSTCTSLQSVTLFNTQNITNTSFMFVNCSSLQSVPLFNTQSVTNMSSMFQGCTSLKSLPLFNTQNVTNISSMFSSCSSLQSVPLLNTQSVTNIGSMFSGCTSLQSVPLLNTQSVTLMNNMFTSCTILKSVPLFNTQNVTNMGAMFSSCSSLQSVPLFNTMNVNNMGGMFQNCASINYIPTFNTSSITTTSGTDFGNFTINSFSIDRIQVSFSRTVGLQNNQLSRTALVEVFNNLVNRSATTSATITISGNWGASALTAADRLIATSKNWVIVG